MVALRLQFIKLPILLSESYDGLGEGLERSYNT